MSKKDIKKNVSTDKYNELTDVQVEELKKLTIQITEEAKLLVKEYANNPSDMSGSLVIVHQDSQLLDESIHNHPLGEGFAHKDNKKNKDDNNDSE